MDMARVSPVVWGGAVLSEPNARGGKSATLRKSSLDRRFVSELSELFFASHQRPNPFG